MGQICSITIRNNNLNYPWTSISLYKYIYIYTYTYTYNLESNPKKCFYSPALFNLEPPRRRLRAPLVARPNGIQRPRRCSWLQTMFGAPDRPCQLCILPWQLGDHDVQGGRSWRSWRSWRAWLHLRWVKWTPLYWWDQFWGFFLGTCSIKKPILVI